MTPSKRAERGVSAILQGAPDPLGPVLCAAFSAVRGPEGVRGMSVFCSSLTAQMAGGETKRYLLRLSNALSDYADALSAPPGEA